MEAERQFGSNLHPSRRQERNLRRPTGSNAALRNPIPSPVTQNRREASCGGERMVEGDEKPRGARESFSSQWPPLALSRLPGL
jgi:hypothetical protein